VAAVLRRDVSARPRWIDVAGPSMAPAIPAGARVCVVGARRPRRGEIWAFCLLDATVVVHRYRRTTGSGLQFQGDASPWPDDPIDVALLIGRVTAVDCGGRTRRLDRWWVLGRDRARLDVAAIGRRLRRRHR
jgi:hypothetical protein